MIRSTLLLVVAAAISGADAFAPVGMATRVNTQLFMGGWRGGFSVIIFLATMICKSSICKKPTRQGGSTHDDTGAKKLEDTLKADPQLKESSRATILECDDMECATAQCTQDNRGNWHCEGGLEGERDNVKTQVLMHSDNDD
eukprot:scaffold6094_cov104-Skeletonema_marinoi.AAC.1